MTNKELSQLYYLNREIELDEKRLRELEAESTSITCNMSGMPSGGGASSKVEKIVAEIVDLKAIIAAKQIQCIHERQRLERYIADVPDSLVRMVLTLRYISGLPWSQVAFSIGGNNTEESVKKICYRHLHSSEVPLDA